MIGRILLLLLATLLSVPARAEEPAADPVKPKKPKEAKLPAAAAPKEPTVVTSERLQVDYTSNTGTFEGNVLAVDPRITVRADKMVVLFGQSDAAAGTTTGAVEKVDAKMPRSLSKIFASGAVVITQEDRKATSEQAEYTAADGKVVLTGNPSLKGPDGTVTGEKITFWRDEQRMEVESKTRLILFPDEDKEPRLKKPEKVEPEK
jgi:lipopolysaccharide transport protein LptA